jgi:hypothetical protein
MSSQDQAQPDQLPSVFGLEEASQAIQKQRRNTSRMNKQLQELEQRTSCLERDRIIG